MAIQTINIGTTANDGTGDDPRTAGSKINDNFTNSNHAASRDVGTAAGDVIEASTVAPLHTGAELANTVGGFFRLADRSLDRPSSMGTYDTYGFKFPRHSSGFGSALFLPYSVSPSGNITLRVYASKTVVKDYVFWNSENTTVDGSGFIKSASPIIKLYSDKIELNDYKEIENCTFECVDTGHYIIKGAPLLSRDGWYIETLKDRNNNIYFTLDYEELEDGLHIKTYTPNYSTGRATNGAPVDINDGRFVTLRFEEDKTEE
jgi:hypothetical protein